MDECISDQHSLRLGFLFPLSRIKGVITMLAVVTKSFVLEREARKGSLKITEYRDEHL